MKIKTICKKYFFTKYFLAGCFFVFGLLQFSCGLDVYYEIESPTIVLHEPSYNSSFGERYFTFETNEVENSQLQGFAFKGTNIYYRIYDRVEDLNRDRSSLDSLANNAINNVSTVSTAAEKLIQTRTTGGFGYQKLGKSTNVTPEILIPCDADNPSNRRIRIRLTNYGPVSEFHAIIDVESDSSYVPVRCNGKSFDFGRHGSNDAMPVQGDEDYSYSESGSDIKYVAMYALGTGYDTNVSIYYSNILYLGSVSIDSTSVDN